MKRMIFGLALLFCGTVWALALTVLSVVRPCEYNDIGGVVGFLLCTETLGFFIAGSIAFLAGLVICFAEAFLKK